MGREVVDTVASNRDKQECAVGCDSLHVSVDEAGAFNTRTLGTCILPFAMFKCGFTGDISFPGVKGSIYVEITKLSEQRLLPEPSAPPLPSTGEDLKVDQPWVAAMQPRDVGSGVQEAQLMPGSGVPVSGPSSSDSRSGVPVDSQVDVVEECAAVDVHVPLPSFVQARYASPAALARAPPQVSEVDGRLAAVLPINLTICTYNVTQILAELVAQHNSQNHTFVPNLHRGSDPTRDLTWLAFGFDLAAKTFPEDDKLFFENGVGPVSMDLAKKLKASLQTISQHGLSPQLNIILTCFQDRRLG